MICLLYTSGSLEEMHEAVVSRWNNKVNNGDTVYILGDMSMRGNKEDLISLVATLKGKQILVKGNHDDVSAVSYTHLDVYKRQAVGNIAQWAKA